MFQTKFVFSVFLMYGMSSTQCQLISTVNRFTQQKNFMSVTEYHFSFSHFLFQKVI